MTKVARILIVLLLLFCTIIPRGTSQASGILHDANNQEQTAQSKAEALLKKMTPSEKVGQLFLVTFEGTATDENSNIYKLITEQRIGGVVLRANNDNFLGPENTVAEAQTMINALQQLNWDRTQSGIPDATGNNLTPPNYIPLLIGLSQEGDLAPFDQIINGMTPLPNEMAIGATWNPANAETVGSILGEELSAIGINLLFGPSLDVLDVVKTDVGEDLGVRTFGGDPYWVAEMGQAYIRGLHNGSKNEIAVIATHFPGRGGSDRQPEDEVSTVRKSLEQLKQIELAPFFAVTKDNGNTAEITDGLLLSHIRYQGFQGNIRATTRPVSFDSAALDQLMSLEEFATWQSNGGILVSDDLGSAAVRKFFDPLNTGFDARQVIKSALLAGNDLLYTGNITASGDADSYTTITRTHDFFVQKYNEDSAFQQRVDEAVLRILTLKYKLNSEFTIAALKRSPYELTQVGISGNQVSEIASQSITMISPDMSELDAVLSEPPQSNERIVFISNRVPQQQCSTCPEQALYLADSLRKAVERLYGPQSGEQILSSKLSAYSFENLEQLLEDNNPPEYLKSDISTATWLVISFTDFQSTSYESEIFHRFFSEQPELTRNKKIIGFSFNAPYYPDATDISKFTAYYAIYSKIPVFVDGAARILFQEIVPTGKLPVSFSSIGYDLITVTTPDPNQIIPLFVELPSEADETTQTPTQTVEAELTYKVGDSLPLRTGVILDHNGNPVPDGTIVRFLIDTKSTSGSIEQIETQTVDGVARTVYRIQNSGVYELRVTADPAEISQILSLEISDTGGQITSIEPTFAPTETATQDLVTPVTLPTPSVTKSVNHDNGIPSGADWFFSSLLILMLAVLLYWWGWQRQLSLWNPRVPSCSVVGGYLAYLYVAAGLPGAKNTIISGGTLKILFLVLLGSVIGTLVALLWRFLERRQKH